MEPFELKQIRKALGLSPIELAQRLGVHRSTVQRWERGLVSIPRVVEVALEGLRDGQATSEAS